MNTFYKFAILFFAMAIIFNKPEDASNAVSMLMFVVSIISGFWAVIKTADCDSKAYGV